MSSSADPIVSAPAESAEPAATATLITEEKGKAPISPEPEPEANAHNPTNDKDAGPVCLITLLLSSGTRHPYKIDDKYLTKRGVEAETVPETGKRDPFSISVYTLKELILREWREEWDNMPASPSSIRLIYFGKLLDDKEPLRKYAFSAENRNVVHMSVRPADIDEEHEPKHGGKASGGSPSTSESTRCCVIL